MRPCFVYAGNQQNHTKKKNDKNITTEIHPEKKPLNLRALNAFKLYECSILIKEREKNNDKK